MLLLFGSSAKAVFNSFVKYNKLLFSHQVVILVISPTHSFDLCKCSCMAKIALLLHYYCSGFVFRADCFVYLPRCLRWVSDLIIVGCREPFMLLVGYPPRLMLHCRDSAGVLCFPNLCSSHRPASNVGHSTLSPF